MKGQFEKHMKGCGAMPGGKKSGKKTKPAPKSGGTKKTKPSY